MLKKIFTPVIALTAIVLFASGCKKSSDSISSTDQLEGTWYVTGITSNNAYDWDGNGSTETDIYSTYSSCQRDITLTFYSDGSGVSRQGCTAPQQNFYWSVTNNGQTLTVDLPSDDIVLQNLRRTSTTLKGEDVVYVNNNQYTITYSFARR